MSATPSTKPPPHRARLALSAGAPMPAAPTAWARVPDTGLPHFDVDSVRAHWGQLHPGQITPVPQSDALAQAWASYHNGDFAGAASAALALGKEGLSLASQATAIYANYVEPREAMRLALFRQVADRTGNAFSSSRDCQTLFWHAYALGRYAQAVSVARALGQGLGGEIKATLERVIALQPLHADAHFALGAFHAEVIDKVGSLVGRMTYGVRAETALALFERGLELKPRSATGLMEYARALIALEGEVRLDDATRLYMEAAEIEPQDAQEALDRALARAGLAE